MVKRKRPGLAQILGKDIGIKLAALLLALFLWFNVAEKRPVEAVVALPLEYVNVPAGMAFASKVPDVARVRVVGSGRFVRWKLKDVHVAIDLSLATRGVNTHLVSPSEVVMNADRGVNVLEIVEPKAVRVDLDVMASREVPITPVVRGDVGEEKIMLAGPTAEPAKAMISGAEKVVSALTGVPTVPVEATSLAKRGRVTARIDLRQFPPLASDVEDVVVAARIEPRKEVGIPAVPIESAGGERVAVSFLPDAVDLVVSGAASQIDSLDPRVVTLVIDVTGLLRGDAELVPVIEGGDLTFEARAIAGGASAGQGRRLKAHVDAPCKLDVVSMTPDEIGLALR